MNGNLAMIHNIPAACIVMGYEDDMFHTSPEKMEGFGKQQYFVGYNAKGRPQFAQVEIKAIGVRDTSAADGMQPVNFIDEINGYNLKDIFVNVTEPTDPRGCRASKTVGGETTDYIEAVLGMRWGDILNNPHSNCYNRGKVSVAQLHKVLFGATINRLRGQGYLPDEETMPIIYAELGNLSKSLLKHGNRVDNTVDILGFCGKPQKILGDLLSVQPEGIKMVQSFLKGEITDEEIVRAAIMKHHEKLSNDQIVQIDSLPDDEAQQVLDYIMKAQGLFFDEKTGLLCRSTDKGPVVDPAAYYPIFSVLLDNDHTSLDEESWYFTSKIQRCQALLKAYNVPISVIRTPHTEIPAFDTIRIHPTGTYYDLKQAEIEIFKKVTSQFRETLSEIMNEVLPQQANGKAVKPTKDTIDAANQLVSALGNEYFHRELAKIRQAVQDKKPHEPAVNTEALVTKEVMGWWVQMLISTLSENREV
jgi:hypothetical protein